MLVASLRYHCELDPTEWIGVGLAFAWTVVSCVVVLIGLVNYFTDYFDLLWPSSRAVVTVSKGKSPGFLM